MINICLCLGILLFGQVFTFDDFVDCGGFIRPSKQLSSIMEERSTKIDYSKDVKVHLLTLDGIKKFTAECAPNGYYIIPVYDKGTFVIKIEGPTGWVFHPNQVSVTIQGNGQCSQDFELIGFSIQGKVVGDTSCPSQSLHAPQGISIALTPLNSNIEIDKQTTLSTTDGTYRFINTFPGEYELEASHPEWTFLKKKIHVVASWGNVHVTEDFVVSGYGITGRVLETSENGEPVKGVNFFLYSDDVKTLQCPKITENVPSNRKTPPLCSFQTDESGTFYFQNIPCGTYTLVPYYKSTHTTYDVIPKEIQIVIDQDTLTIATPFLVKGYSVVGRVVGANSEGIEGVLVKATTEHEERTATTDTTGEYTLDQITSGEYTITAEKLHHVFSTLTKYKISPNIAQLTDVVASRYHVCGRVFVPHPPVGVSIEKRKISLDPLDKSTPPLTSRTDQTGAFCIPALPGKYTIFPEIKPEEIEAGLQLTETLLEVVVDSLPVLDVNFEQARLTVSGRVRCIESPCDTSLSVSLNAIGRASRVTTGLAIGHDDSSGEDHFIFKGVLPGKYEVTINHENWCWEKENEIIEVTIKDQNDIQFVQTGYVLVVKTSHDLDLLYTIDDKNEGKVFGLVKGKNTFCLPKPGVYRFTPRCCYRFELDPYSSSPSSQPSSHSSATPSYVYDTTKPYVLKLNAQYYKVEGKIRLQNIENQQIISENQEDLAHIRINVTANEVNQVIFALKADNNHYTLTYWSELGQKLVFTPVSSVLFFYPQSISTSVEKSECQEELPPFDARPGMYLSGTITPPYPGVLISVHFEETGNPALPLLNTTTTGTYHAGPLYDDRTYVVTASKWGYHLRPVPNQKGNFTALKLGSVLVRVTYQDTPLPGVLLSLSGGEGYKNNNATDSSGSFQFQDLFPGEYYLRPILKEYLFTPTANSITIKEGEESKIEIVSTRVAYSCYGKVISLNGEPEKGVTVEAVGPDGLYEETQSDGSGIYRLRGLFPNKDYSIGVKFGAKNTKLSRAEPRHIPINITTSDVENVNFLVFRKTFKYDITGVVIADQKVLPTLTVQLLTTEKESNNMKLMSEVSVGPNYFFSFNSLDGTTEYIVKLKTELSKHSYHYTLPEEKVSNLATKEVQPTKLVLKFEITEQKFETEVENGSFRSLILIIIIVIIVYYNKFIIDFGKQYVNRPKQERVEDDWSSEWKKSNMKKKK